ncbi:MAG: polymer-forming cytoskeletal protein [Gemmatimonadota bacterium]|nr:polymer-forming cytoskeletal protein [Gemmatimonadota bacterium]
MREYAAFASQFHGDPYGGRGRLDSGTDRAVEDGDRTIVSYYLGGFAVLGKKTKDEREVTTSHGPSEGRSSTATKSIISKEMHIRGDCFVEGGVRIEGTISGNVTAAAVELGKTGSVEGDLDVADTATGQTFLIAGRVDGAVRAPRVDVARTGTVLRGVVADEANVHGRIEGGVVARRRLVLEESAVVEGDVRAVKLALKEGGQVNGTILMGEQATRADAEMPAEPKAEPPPEANEEPEPPNDQSSQDSEKTERVAAPKAKAS